ncbi:MAG: hypothetical protein IJ099_02850 [Alphaproteobacteria bacterium]|nr:hypothetical protein [Alphaproteobacteria bacterium]
MLKFFLHNNWKCKLFGLVLGLAFCSSPAYSDVCFLPSGGCGIERAVSNTYNPTGTENCSNYNGYIKTSSEITNAKECHSCGGNIYCLCPDGAKLSGSECVCEDRDKVLQGGSCQFCGEGKEPVNATTCQCKSQYSYTPLTHEVCTRSCGGYAEAAASFKSFLANDSNVRFSSASITPVATIPENYTVVNNRAIAYYKANSTQIANKLENSYVNSRTLSLANAASNIANLSVAPDLRTTASAGSFLTSAQVSNALANNAALSQAYISSERSAILSSAQTATMAYADLFSSLQTPVTRTSGSLGNKVAYRFTLYDEDSCSCESGYEYFGSGSNKQCLEKCGNDRTRQSDGTCACANERKIWNGEQCVCDPDKYIPNDNGGCEDKLPECPPEKLYNSETGQCECPASAPYETEQQCKDALNNQQAYNLNWWDIMQQKTASALSEVAECLLPKAAYALTEPPEYQKYEKRDDLVDINGQIPGGGQQYIDQNKDSDTSEYECVPVGVCWSIKKGCDVGYHDQGDFCVLNTCPTGTAQSDCDTANGYTFEPNNTTFINTSGDTVLCGECKVACTAENYPYSVPSTGWYTVASNVCSADWDKISNGSDKCISYSSTYKTYYAKFDNGDSSYCNSGKACFDEFRNDATMITRGGDGATYLFSKINKDSEHCTTTDNGNYVVRYKSLCATNSVNHIGGLTDSRTGANVMKQDCPDGLTFTENCSSVSSYKYKNNHFYPVNSTSYGYCGCATSQECERERAENEKCVSIRVDNSTCYVAKECATENECKTGHNLATNQRCVADNDGCYSVEEFVYIDCNNITFHSEYEYPSQPSIYNETVTLNGTTACNASKKTSTFKEGTYTVCWNWKGGAISSVGVYNRGSALKCYNSQGTGGCEKAEVNASFGSKSLCASINLTASPYNQYYVNFN